MSRKLATIQTIWKIEPIEGADRIELAYVLGWQCVVNKDKFKVGDLAVYFEIDSFLPIRPEFEFLRNSSYKNNEILGEGFRLKTQKFRGQVSQGLLLPVDQFDEIPTDIELGADVTETLGVRKWEINIDYYISTKMDGSSHSISVDENGVHVTGHNYEYKDDGNSSFYNLVNERNYKEIISAFKERKGLDSLVIQGELCGAGIQQNRLKLKKPEWYVFTVIENGKRVGLGRMLDICCELGLVHVPIEEVASDLPSKYPTVESLLERADGEYPNGGKKEGIVIRPVEPIFSNAIGTNLSMKVVSNKYLLKNE